MKKIYSFFNISKSICAKISACMLLLFVVLYVISSIFWYTQSNNLIYTNYSSYLEDTIQRSNENFGSDIQNLTLLLDTISQSSTTLKYFDNGLSDNNSDELAIYISELYQLYENLLSGIAIFDNNGIFISTGNIYLPKDYIHSDWFNQIHQNGDTPIYIFDNIANKNANSKRKLSIVRAIISKNTVVGGIVVKLNTNLYTKSFGATALKSAMRTLIFVNDTIIYSNDSTTTEALSKQLMNEASAKLFSDGLFKICTDNKTYLGSSQQNPYTGWINLTYFDKDIIDREFNLFFVYAFVFIFAALVLATLISGFISNAFSKKTSKVVSQINDLNLYTLKESESHYNYATSDEIDVISFKINEMQKKLSTQFDEIQTLTTQKRLSDLHILQSQINPHFLYNTLNSIGQLAKMHNDTPVSVLTQSLVSMLHYSMRSDTTFVSLRAELDYVEKYINIMNTNYFDKIDYIQNIDPQLLDCKILKMIIQPIVENCIKHAFPQKSEKRIILKVALYNQNLTITITDNGGNFPQDIIQKINNGTLSGEHIGIKNVDRRIKLEYGQEYGLNIMSLPDIQSSVIINIPYVPHYESKED